MNNQKTINSQKITCMLACILPIIPWYFRVVNTSFLNIVCIVYVFAILVLNRGILKCSIKRRYTFFTIIGIFWVITNIITFALYGDITEIIVFPFKTIFLFVAFIHSIKTKEGFLNIIKWVLNSAIVVSLLGIVEEITRFNVFSLLKPDDYVLNYNPLRFGVLRILGFTEHTIVYGLYFMFCLALCVYYMQFINGRKRVIYKYIYLLFWINVILTLSRSTILATLLSQILILYFSGRKKFLLRIVKYSALLLIIIGLLSTFVPKILEMVTNVFYMILAVFNDGYTEIIESAFGGDNLHATGDRLDLYKWVFSSMGNGWLFGNGKDTPFLYSYSMSNGLYTWNVVKDCIEVQYLRTLFGYGIFGCCAEILLYLSILSISIKNRIMDGEKSISFNNLAIATLIPYYIQLFAVNQTSERSIFYIFCFLLIIYNMNLSRKINRRRPNERVL